MEGKGKPEEASRIFLQPWNEVTNGFEKFTATYFVARQLQDVSSQFDLSWCTTMFKKSFIK